MLLVFDFDGTIVHSKKMCLFVFKKAFKKYGLSFTYSQIAPHFGPPAKIVIESLIGRQKLNKKIEKEVDFLKRTIGLKMMKLRCRSSFLKKLAKKHFLILRTNADRSSTFKFLKKHKIFNLWQEIITPENRISKSKIKTLRYFKNKFKNRKLPPVVKQGLLRGSARHCIVSDSAIVYIGDLVDDIKAARSVGIYSIAILGWDKTENLRKAKPNFLIRQLNSLPKILKIIEKYDK